MLRLTVLLLLGALGWMTWWAFGQLAYEEGLATWIEDRRGDGWVAEVGDLKTVGFPNRFDTTLSDVRFADPATGVAWSAEMVQFLSLAYRPNQVIAVLPPTHRFSTPFETLTFAHDDARASLFLGASTNLPLERARLVTEGLSVSSSLGQATSLSEGRFAFERLEGSATSYRLGTEILDLNPSQTARRVLDPGGLLPETVQSLRLDAELDFTQPWDRRAIEAARPQLTEIDLKDLSARWGNVTFRAVGAVTVDSAGLPEGEVTVRAVEWRKLLAMAHAVGWLTESMVGPMETALELMSGSTDTLDATLEFSDGSIWLGPIPLGPAPVLTLR